VEIDKRWHGVEKVKSIDSYLILQAIEVMTLITELPHVKFWEFV